MARISAFTDSEQLSLDDVLAELRDTSPPEVTAAVGIPTSGAIRGDVSHLKIGIEPHNDGDCPYMQRCEKRRRRLPHYRETIPCHWRAWGDWRRYPIYRNGATDEPGV
jgi:hypothetical protein